MENGCDARRLASCASAALALIFLLHCQSYLTFSLSSPWFTFYVTSVTFFAFMQHHLMVQLTHSSDPVLPFHHCNQPIKRTFPYFLQLPILTLFCCHARRSFSARFSGVHSSQCFIHTFSRRLITPSKKATIYAATLSPHVKHFSMHTGVISGEVAEWISCLQNTPSLPAFQGTSRS